MKSPLTPDQLRIKELETLVERLQMDVTFLNTILEAQQRDMMIH